MLRLSWACTSSPQSVGGPRAGETDGGLSGLPRCVTIPWFGPGSRAGSPQQPEVAKSAKGRNGFALVKPLKAKQPDVTTAVGALEWNLLAHSDHQLGPGFCVRCHVSGYWHSCRGSLPGRARRRHDRRWRLRSTQALGQNYRGLRPARGAALQSAGVEAGSWQVANLRHGRDQRLGLLEHHPLVAAGGDRDGHSRPPQ